MCSFTKYFMLQPIVPIECVEHSPSILAELNPTSMINKRRSITQNGIYWQWHTNPWNDDW